MTHQDSVDVLPDSSSDQISPPTRETRRSRQKRQRDAMKAAMADGPAVAPPLNSGPGRPRILDPDQATLEGNIRRLYAAAPVQTTLPEMAALLGVSLDTLGDFFHRYPTVKEKCDDCRLSGRVSIHTQLFKNMAGDGRNRPDPETARWMAERFAGVEDPYRLKELDLRERAFARQREESEQNIELKKQELAQRERDLVIREQAHELKIKDLGPGLPIDIKSLSLPQLMQLAERLRASMIAGPSLTIEGVKNLS
jgi:hypothetical protein